MPQDGTGTGSIARAADVLDALAGSADGLALSEVVERTTFSKTTAHRVLGALQSVRYVVQDPQTRLYRLGTRLADLGRQARMTDIAALGRPGLHRLAQVTGDTVFLAVPEGSLSLCVARATGAYPIRTLTLDRGDRRPLGIGAGALALYCAMPEAARDAANRMNARWLAEYGFDAAMLESARRDFERQGYALNPGDVVAGMAAVGLPVRGPDGAPVASLAVGAITERMTSERIADVILPVLIEETTTLAERLSAPDDEDAA